MKDFKIYYGLEFNPFEKGQPDIPVETSDYREAMGRLNYLKDVRGIGLFTGRSGTGKSFIMKKFSETLNPGLYKVIYMPMSTLSTIEFYRELSHPDDIFWNSEKLAEHTNSIIDGLTIANGLKMINKLLKGEKLNERRRFY